MARNGTIEGWEGGRGEGAGSQLARNLLKQRVRRLADLVARLHQQNEGRGVLFQHGHAARARARAAIVHCGVQHSEGVGVVLRGSAVRREHPHRIRRLRVAALHDLDMACRKAIGREHVARHEHLVGVAFADNAQQRDAVQHRRDHLDGDEVVGLQVREEHHTVVRARHWPAGDDKGLGAGRERERGCGDGAFIGRYVPIGGSLLRRAVSSECAGAAAAGTHEQRRRQISRQRLVLFDLL